MVLMDNDKVSVVWQPVPKSSQELFLTCPIREVLFQGSRGGGKTDCMLMSFGQNVGIGYGIFWKGVIFRRSYKELDDIINKSQKWFRKIFPDAQFLRGKGDYKWIFADGEELYFRHFSHVDDYWNYHGQEYPFIGWEELTTWPDSTGYEKMFSCNRVGYSPDKVDTGLCIRCSDHTTWYRASDGTGIPKNHPDYRDPNVAKRVICDGCQFELPQKCIPQVRSTTNTFGVGHSWVKQYFIDNAKAGTPFLLEGKKRERVHIASNLVENPHLNPEYIDDIRQLDDENLKAAWLFGSWDIVAGGMFSHVWETSTHMVDAFDIPSTWRLDRSFDWGNSKPFCTLWFAESDGSDYIDADGNSTHTNRGDIFVVFEDYGWNGTPNEGIRATNKEMARRIKAIENDNPMFHKRRVHAGPADSAIWTVENGHSIKDDMQVIGVNWRRADKSAGSRKAGWSLIIQKLKNAVTKEGPGLYFFDNCIHSKRLIPVTPRDEKDMDDIDTEFEDHLQDALRYRIRKKTNNCKVRQL